VTVTFRDEEDPERDAVLEGLWEAFYETHVEDLNVAGELLWDFDEDTRTATIVW
jgi:hypothetical protein